MGAAFGTKEIRWTMPVLPKAKYGEDKMKVSILTVPRRDRIPDQEEKL